MAINVLHPFVGLVTFSVGVVVMVLLITPLGMHIGIGERPPEPAAARPVPRARCPQHGRQTKLPGVPKVYVAIIVALVAGTGAGHQQPRPADLQPGGRRLRSAQARGLHPVRRRPRRGGDSRRAPRTTGPSPCSATPRSGTATSCTPPTVGPLTRRPRSWPTSSTPPTWPASRPTAWRTATSSTATRWPTWPRCPWRWHHRPGHVLHLAAVRKLVDRVLDHPGQARNVDHLSSGRCSTSRTPATESSSLPLPTPRGSPTSPAPLSPSDVQLVRNRAFLVAFARELIGVETGHPEPERADEDRAGWFLAARLGGVFSVREPRRVTLDKIDGGVGDLLPRSAPAAGVVDVHGRGDPPGRADWRRPSSVSVAHSVRYRAGGLPARGRTACADRSPGRSFRGRVDWRGDRRPAAGRPVGSRPGGGLGRAVGRGGERGHGGAGRGTSRGGGRDSRPCHRRRAERAPLVWTAWGRPETVFGDPGGRLATSPGTVRPGSPASSGSPPPRPGRAGSRGGVVPRRCQRPSGCRSPGR